MSDPVFMLRRTGRAHGEFDLLRPKSLRSEHDIETACRAFLAAEPAGGGKSLWIADAAAFLARSLLEIASRKGMALGFGARALRSNLLLLDEPSTAAREVLERWFSVVLAKERGMAWLSDEELAAVLAAENAADFVIAGAADEEAGTLLLYRGDFGRLVIPLKSLTGSAKSPPRQVSKLAIEDFGQTVRLGAFGVSTHALLYELDPAYRKRARARLLEADESFGGSLRRLRTLRKLTRADFSPVSSKEVARLERNEIARPHRATLLVLAKRLRVSVEELGSY